MIYSMTGYGKGAAENDRYKIEIEVKSVNSRYLEIGLKFPQSLATKEYELREFIKNKIKRGKLSVLILLRKKEDAEADFSVNEDKLKNYLNVINELKEKAKITEKIKLEHILANKDIFEMNEPEFSDSEFELVKSALDQALTELLKMKNKEGKELADDLKKRIEIIEERLKNVENESDKSVKEYYEKLKDKVKLLTEDVTVNEDRMAMELAVIADKADITEECVRLHSHIKFFNESIQSGGEPGRKLNFLCQEMNRETNTISSKTISTLITHNTVYIKEEIEKIREQIQNIE